MYAGMQGSGAEAAAQAAAGAAGGAQQPTAGAKNDDVVDADYKEVKRG
jgi:molecular chaperone DnaK